MLNHKWNMLAEKLLNYILTFLFCKVETVLETFNYAEKHMRMKMQVNVFLLCLWNPEQTLAARRHFKYV